MPHADNKTALVLAGGGIMGAAYEIGCLTALDRLFPGRFDARRFDIYVGISAGSVIATLIANRIAPARLFQIIGNNESTLINWRRSDIYRLDWGELLSSCWDVFRNLFRVLRNYRRNHWKLSLNDLFYILQEQFPSGLYSLGPMEKYLCHAFAREGILDDFHLIKPELYIPAYDLDRGHRIVFGTEGYREQHICQAITASCAIPYFFRPHKVGNRFYIDGSVGHIPHLDIAIERGAKLIVIVNPRVPMDNDMEHFCLPSLSFGECSSIADLGITFAWEQSQRIENQSKLDMALQICRRDHPDVDILIIQPGSEESMLFFQSPMSNVARAQTMNYGYNLTLEQLRDRFQEFHDVFDRHGIPTSRDALRQAPPADAV